jgi:hypothetical protein
VVPKTGRVPDGSSSRKPARQGRAAAYHASVLAAFLAPHGSHTGLVLAIMAGVVVLVLLISGAAIAISSRRRIRPTAAVSPARAGAPPAGTENR